MTYNKEELISYFILKDYEESFILDQVRELVKYMHTVKIGECKIDCVYNGQVEWNFKGSNSGNLDDYYYTISE